VSKSQEQEEQTECSHHAKVREDPEAKATDRVLPFKKFKVQHRTLCSGHVSPEAIVLIKRGRRVDFEATYISSSNGLHASEGALSNRRGVTPVVGNVNLLKIFHCLYPENGPENLLQLHSAQRVKFAD